MHVESTLFEEDWAIVESLLPEGWQEKCKELKVYQLNRAFDGPGDLLRTLLIHAYRDTRFALLPLLQKREVWPL